MSKPVCVVVGVGPKNGAAIAHKFSREGYKVAVLARSAEYVAQLASELEEGKGYVCDVTKAERIAEVFGLIREELGPVETLVYNAGSGQFKDFDETTPEILEQAWQINVRGCFLASKEVVPQMREAGGGNIMVIGATAALRGKAGTLPFASAKASQMIMLESMARKLGPEGIHVAYLILDGFVYGEQARKMAPDHWTDDDFLQPDAVADNVFYLCKQPRTTWTFQLTLRPARETW